MENIDKQQDRDLLKTIVEKAWENPEFKSQLIDNPSKTISNIIGRELSTKMPNGKELVVVDQSDEGIFYLNIPVKPKLDLELSEQELELVAGGGCSIKQAGIDTANWIEDKIVDPISNWWNS